MKPFYWNTWLTRSKPSSARPTGLSETTFRTSTGRDGWTRSDGRPPTAAYWRNESEPMLDFSKWAAMWDAYAESSPGDPTPGTPAAMCFNIGLIMVIGGIIGAIIRLTSESDKLVAVFLAGLLGVALLLASFFLPSHNDAHVSEPPTLTEQIERT